MISQSGNCRVCGSHFSSDSLSTHELSCLQSSQEQTNVTSTDENSESQVNEKNQESSSTSACGSKNDEENTTSSENTTPSISDMVPYPSLPEGYSNSQSAGRSTSFQSSSSARHSIQTEYSASDPKRYGRDRNRNLFPPTKKYWYYPVTCEYCRKRFQPGELKAHQTKHHFKEIGLGSPQQRSMSTAARKNYDDNRRTDRSKSVGGIPRCLKICYICGKLYGSKSIKIHEPKCLDKWRIQNDKLPPHRRAPEPIKPAPEMALPGSSTDDYSMPTYDPTVDAAFRSHLSSLIPCTHCERTFSPDRILTHESCCIERPKYRECKTPPGGEIPR